VARDRGEMSNCAVSLPATAGLSSGCLGWKMRWKILYEPLRKTVSQSRLPAQGDKRPCHKMTGNLPFGHHRLKAG